MYNPVTATERNLLAPNVKSGSAVQQGVRSSIVSCSSKTISPSKNFLLRLHFKSNKEMSGVLVNDFVVVVANVDRK